MTRVLKKKHVQGHRGTMSREFNQSMPRILIANSCDVVQLLASYDKFIQANLIAIT